MSDVMPEGAEAFTKKIGPFPGYVWVIGVAGIGWIIYLKKKQSVSAAVTAPSGAETVFPSTYGNAPGTNNSTGLVQSGAMSTATPSNDSWAKMVTDALITAGGDPTNISNAISTWLSGGNLDPTQQAIVNTVERQYGTPPMGVLPVNVQHDASSYSGHTYATQAGDTLDSILSKFYGNLSNEQKQIALARISTGNGLQWNQATGSYDLKAGQNLKLYSDAATGVGDNTLHWP